MVCSSFGSLLRPLFYFLCSILLIYRVDLKPLGNGKISQGKLLGNGVVSFPRSFPSQNGLAGFSVLQIWVIGRVLGCASPVSWLPLAAGHKFTQPMPRLTAHHFINTDTDMSKNCSVKLPSRSDAAQAWNRATLHSVFFLPKLIIVFCLKHNFYNMSRFHVFNGPSFLYRERLKCLYVVW